MALMNRQRLILIWIGAAVVLGGLQAIAVASYSKQDDPDQAAQRPGFISNQSEHAPPIEGVSYSKRPTVIIFDRMAMASSIFHDLADQAIISERANLVLITNRNMKPKILNGTTVVATDSSGALATSFQLNKPSDGGYPIGYVIVDSHGFIRYRTLDPEYAHHGDEIEIILKDVKK